MLGRENRSAQDYFPPHLSFFPVPESSGVIFGSTLRVASGSSSVNFLGSSCCGLPEKGLGASMEGGPWHPGSGSFGNRLPSAALPRRAAPVAIFTILRASALGSRFFAALIWSDAVCAALTSSTASVKQMPATARSANGSGPSASASNTGHSPNGSLYERPLFGDAALNSLRNATAARRTQGPPFLSFLQRHGVRATHAARAMRGTREPTLSRCD